MDIIKIKHKLMLNYNKTFSKLYFKVGKEEAINLLINWTIDLNKYLLQKK